MREQSNVKGAAETLANGGRGREGNMEHVLGKQVKSMASRQAEHWSMGHHKRTEASLNLQAKQMI